MLCYGTSILLTACLFFCPPIWPSLALIATTKSMAQIVAILVCVEVGQIFPVRVRGTLVGFGGFLMLAPLPLYPFFIEILSKKSIHYLTAVTIGMFSYGFLGALFFPSSKDADPDEDDERNVDDTN